MANTEARKLTLARKPNEPIRLGPGEAVHVGVDVHKASYSVALYSDGRGLIATWACSRPGRAARALPALPVKNFPQPASFKASAWSRTAFRTVFWPY